MTTWHSSWRRVWSFPASSATSALFSPTQPFFRSQVQSRFQEAIKTEKTQLQELEHQIRKVEREVAALRKDDVSDHKLIEQAVAREKSVHLLENRLHNVRRIFQGFSVRALWSRG